MFLVALALLSTAFAPEAPRPNSTGRLLTPIGASVDVGGFPVNLEVSPDGRFVAVTNTGIEQNLTLLDAVTGEVLSQLRFNQNAPGRDSKDGLYFGLDFVQEDGQLLLYASHGSEDRVAAYAVSPQGELSGPVRTLENKRPGVLAVIPHFQAGIAVSSDGETLYAVNNQSFALNDFAGGLSKIDVASGEVETIAKLPAFPLDIALITQGPTKDAKAYVTSERDGVVAVVDTATMEVVKTIPVGTQPTHLLLDAAQERLFVSCANADSVHVIDVATDTQLATLLVRPMEMRGLPGANPLGMALSPDESRLYVALSDLNAVGVVDLASEQLIGLIPTGWYPTDVVALGDRLMVSIGKGERSFNPNTPETYLQLEGMSPFDPRGNPSAADTGPNIRANLRGLVNTFDVPASLPEHTAQVIANNFLAEPPGLGINPDEFNPGIEHVIYIVKENRTYDQFFGDFPEGNGRPDLLLYGDDVVPNQRALARRFVLLDNFHCCAEMSADGWSWSVAGITSEYVQRNAQYEYSGRSRNYDYEGQNNGTPADARGMRNVNDPPGGYLWDNCVANGVEFRNYGMYIAAGVPIRTLDGRPIAEDNSITMRAFEGRADLTYRMYDMNYADSDAWDAHGLTFPNRLEEFGGVKSRYQAWKRDYDRLIAEDAVPPLMIIRLPNDHTAGTTPGNGTPAAMIADNDYAVGQLVEAVSIGPLWEKTCIIIVEDDAQGGFDHVDAHRSICFVVSPFVEQGSHDGSFYNTDSAIRTVELLLGLMPTNQMVATAAPLRVFGPAPTNRAPFRAILPPAETFVVNTEASYRAADSARLFHTYREESAPDRELADILWGDRKGALAPRPWRRHIPEDED